MGAYSLMTFGMRLLRRREMKMSLVDARRLCFTGLVAPQLTHGKYSWKILRFELRCDLHQLIKALGDMGWMIHDSGWSSACGMCTRSDHTASILPTHTVMLWKQTHAMNHGFPSSYSMRQPGDLDPLLQTHL